MAKRDPRTEVPDDGLTIKMQLIAAIIEALREAMFAPDTTDPALVGVKLFEFVDPGTLEDIPSTQTPAGRVEMGETVIRDGMNMVIDKQTRLYVHVKLQGVVGVDPAPLLDYYFGRIANVLVTPDHFADIAFDISEAGNSPQYLGPSDPEPGGSIYFDADYRHGRGNHFSEDPDYD